MKRQSTIFILLLFILCTGCNTNKADKYIGFWQKENAEISPVMEIKKEGKQFYVTSEDIEVQAIYDKETETLIAEVSSALASAKIHFNLLDDTNLKAGFNGKTENYKRLSEKEAIKAKEKRAAYYNPDFFIGKWINTESNIDTLIIFKEDSSYYIPAPFVGKLKMEYNQDAKTIGYKTLTGETSFKRINENEIQAFPLPITYRKLE